MKHKTWRLYKRIKIKLGYVICGMLVFFLPLEEKGGSIDGLIPRQAVRSMRNNDRNWVQIAAKNVNNNHNTEIQRVK